MEGNNSLDKKDLTINDLAQIVTEGFEKVDKGFKESREHTKKLLDEKIEWLARITQNNFLSVEGRLGKIETGMEDIKANLNKKVDTFAHKDLEIRVEKVEEKLQLKPKLKFA